MVRLQRLADGFSSFTTNGLTGPGEGAAAAVNAQLLDESAKEALKVVFSREGSYIQVCLDSFRSPL